MEQEASARRVGVIRAFFGNLLFGGLGYLYVGRPKYAVVALLSPMVLSALIGWSRLVLIPSAFLIFFGTCIAAILFLVIHPVAITLRNKHIPYRKFNRWWVYLLWVALAIGIGVIHSSQRARFYGFEPFRVPSVSNSPSVESGDLLIANTWRYKNQDPELGEFVVYNVGNDTKYIKRVVGLPGDTVELRDGVLIRNGASVSEPYLHTHHNEVSFGRNYSPIQLQQDEFFMLGDYRDNSQDSRMMGPVRRQYLHGRGEFIWFSYFDGQVQWSRFGRSRLPTSER